MLNPNDEWFFLNDDQDPIEMKQPTNLRSLTGLMLYYKKSKTRPAVSLGKQIGKADSNNEEKTDVKDDTTNENDTVTTTVPTSEQKVDNGKNDSTGTVTVSESDWVKLRTCFQELNNPSSRSGQTKKTTTTRTIEDIFKKYRNGGKWEDKLDSKLNDLDVNDIDNMLDEIDTSVKNDKNNKSLQISMKNYLHHVGCDSGHTCGLGRASIYLLVIFQKFHNENRAYSSFQHRGQPPDMECNICKKESVIMFFCLDCAFRAKYYKLCEPCMKKQKAKLDLCTKYISTAVSNGDNDSKQQQQTLAVKDVFSKTVPDLFFWIFWSLCWSLLWARPFFVQTTFFIFVVLFCFVFLCVLVLYAM